jgi:hypothetical protein
MKGLANLEKAFEVEFDAIRSCHSGSRACHNQLFGLWAVERLGLPRRDDKWLRQDCRRG